jgi:hypothetical protein
MRISESAFNILGGGNPGTCVISQVAPMRAWKGRPCAGGRHRSLDKGSGQTVSCRRKSAARKHRVPRVLCEVRRRQPPSVLVLPARDKDGDLATRSSETGERKETRTEQNGEGRECCHVGTVGRRIHRREPPPHGGRACRSGARSKEVLTAGLNDDSFGA